MTDADITSTCLNLAGRLLTQREARNGYRFSHLALVNRSDLSLAMNLLALAATRIEELQSAVDLQGASAADANAQANTMRRLLGEALEVMECNDPRQPMLGRMRAALGNAPANVPAQPAAVPEGARRVFICGECEGVYADHMVSACDCHGEDRPSHVVHEGYIVVTNSTIPLEIAGSLLPDDYVSPRLAAEAYRENEPDDQTCGACGGIHDTLTPCDQVAAQQNREKGQ